MPSIYSIYKAVNVVNDKCYIGFDSNWPNRQKGHKHMKKCPKLDKALRKYGWDAFQWEVIYQSLDGQYCLNVMEPYFIQQYDSQKNGYNCTLGGGGTLGYTHTEEAKRKMAKVGKPGHPHTEEHKQYMSKILSKPKVVLCCQQCGKEYQVVSSRKEISKFCSKPCHFSFRKFS